MTYAILFDASACSGCKACQIACKDKNNLPLGVLWRRVYEVSGGSWQRQGNAWITDVFAYNVSISCNHCTHPKCAGVCPTNAYVIREDGIVVLDSSKCMGCGYCSWACPYAAPQYNYETGSMSKCDFCYEDIKQDLPPACVAACPLRVLEVAEIRDERLESESVTLWEMPGAKHPYPLPAYSRTEPHLAIKPHAAMLNGLEKSIANREEIKPSVKPSKIRRFWTPKRCPELAEGFPNLGLEELPLVAFTILAQLAVGISVLTLTISDIPFSLLLMIGIILGVAGMFSFLHLGSPSRAWRALNNLAKSWLSREILMTGLFVGSWLLTLIFPDFGKWVMLLTGIGLVYSMAQVYRLKSTPGWNTWRTPASFFLTVGTLGAITTNFWLNDSLLIGMIAFLLVGEAVTLPAARPAYTTMRDARLSLIRVGILAALIIPFLSNPLKAAGNISIFLIVLVEEILGRWLFYEAREDL